MVRNFADVEKARRKEIEWKVLGVFLFMRPTAKIPAS
jgi:hypothetical protein